MLIQIWPGAKGPGQEIPQSAVIPDVPKPLKPNEMTVYLAIRNKTRLYKSPHHLTYNEIATMCQLSYLQVRYAASKLVHAGLIERYTTKYAVKLKDGTIMPTKASYYRVPKLSILDDR